jgi:hypothetical protein
MGDLVSGVVAVALVLGGGTAIFLVGGPHEQAGQTAVEWTPPVSAVPAHVDVMASANAPVEVAALP